MVLHHAGISLGPILNKLDALSIKKKKKVELGSLSKVSKPYVGLPDTWLAR